MKPNASDAPMLNQLIVNGLIAGAIIALLAVGFTVLYSGSQFFVFTYGASYTWAAYTPLLLAGKLPHALAAVFGVALAVVVGMLLEVSVFRSIRSRRSSALILMLASIGGYVVLQNIISVIFGDSTRSVRSWTVREGYPIFAARVTDIQILIAAASIGVSIMTWLLLEFTGLGRRLRAVANDVELARVVGIDVDRTILFATVLGSTLAGIAGVLISLDTDLVPTMGFQALLLGVVACIVGGVNSIKGAVIGGMFVGLAQHLGVWKLPTQWQDAIVFLILILFLLVRPQGFLGKPLRKTAI